MRATTIALLLVAAAGVAQAQVQVCQNSKPGMVPATTIKLSSTAYSNSYSNLVVNWPRPQDGNPVSCITEYLVEVFRRDGQRLQSAIVSINNPAHSGASYEAKGLSPGQPYQFTVQAKGPGGTGATDIKSTPFTTAQAPPTPPPANDCRQPQQVGNIRRAGANPSGSNVAMTIAWDASSTPAACIKDYIITTYLAGSTNALKTTTVPATQTYFLDNIYQPGQSYEFFIYARNPNMGASGNGIGMRSQPIMAPTTATPL